MVHVQQNKEEKLKEKSRDAKRKKTGDGEFLHSRSDGHGLSKCRKNFSGQCSYNAPVPTFIKFRVCNPKPEGGNSGGSSFSTYTRCGRKHQGKCQASSNACVGCEKMDHKIKVFPSVSKNEGDNRRRAHPSLFQAPVDVKSKIDSMHFKLINNKRVLLM
ncbi:hypothetical protein MTR67_018270 [Solanum verrucosum]|uniref:Uncharacterized protein n=1 Tax=Solanum verrucosum TaxID=315347 RepID=A0AAF0QPG2_SOLVR|nr:hypothetical protein MTR67_018270 [Solanum verrucosum]